MTQKILVTGGAGFIGSHLVDALVTNGHDVIIYDNLDPQVHSFIPEYLNTKAKFVKADIRNEEKLKEAVKDVDVIFHQAAVVGVGQSMYDIERYMDVNTLGTAKLLKILINIEHNIKKLVVASSMSIYGEGKYLCHKCGVVYPKLRDEAQMKKHEWEMKCPACGDLVNPEPTDEEKPIQPTSVYAISKRDQEEMCLVIGRSYSIPTVALRYFNVYGPRQSLNNPYTGVCAIFSSRIKNNNPPLIFEDGLQTRDFVNVQDIVQANLLVLKKNRTNYETFNVGTGKPTSIRDMAETLIELYEKSGKLKPRIVNKFRAGDIRHCYADIEKIKKIGFKPKVKLEEGMGELVEWGEAVEAMDKTGQAFKELLARGLIKGKKK